MKATTSLRGDGLYLSTCADESVFELTRDELDELPFGVITLDRSGKILRFNRAEASLAGRAGMPTVGLYFFTDVAPCTNVQAFRGRFDAFARGEGTHIERFEFTFNFRWGRQDVAITMLRKAMHDEINIVVHGKSLGNAVERTGPERRDSAAPRERSNEIDAAIGALGTSCLIRPTVCRLGGSEEAAVRSRIHVDDAAGVEKVVAAAALEKASYTVEYRSVQSDKSIAIIQESGFFGSDPVAPGWATLMDISARRHNEEANFRAAQYDALTGLPNQQLLLRRIGVALTEAEATGRFVGVLVSNIDKFREINDMFGREVGNALLAMLALRLGECVRGGDTVARLGGDWFAVLVADVDSRVSVGDTARRLSAAVSKPFVIDERPYYLTLSTGIGVGPDDGNDSSTLLRAAYTAVSAAKTSGHVEFEWYDRAMSVDATNDARLRNELRAALQNSELEVHYQPIVDVVLDRVVAVESLVRWNHPTRGMLPPGEFIALADRTGFIIPLGRWVMGEACRQARQWCDLGFDLRVCVNVSAVQFREPDFVPLVSSILAQSELAPERLELELTESVMIDGFDDMMEKLSRLKSLGVRLAIDDFGTGYSSLAYLKYFPVDTLKIDRAFVTDIVVDKFDRAIATTVLTLAEQLGLDCVVEGVETAEQLETLRAIGCRIMQGYYFCKPTTPARLSAMLGAAVISPHAA